MAHLSVSPYSEIPHKWCVITIPIFSLPVLSFSSQLSHSCLYESGIEDLLLLNPEVSSLIYLTENPSSSCHCGPLPLSSNFFFSRAPWHHIFCVPPTTLLTVFSQSLLLTLLMWDPPGFNLWISSLPFPSLLSSHPIPRPNAPHSFLHALSSDLLWSHTIYTFMMPKSIFLVLCFP